MKENTFLVHCNFIIGSNAEGCLVIIVGEFDNITANVKRNSSKLLDTTLPLSCYYEIVAFDIESDGSNGNLAVPGELISIQDTSLPCLQPDSPTSYSS